MLQTQTCKAQSDASLASTPNLIYVPRMPWILLPQQRVAKRQKSCILLALIRSRANRNMCCAQVRMLLGNSETNQRAAVSARAELIQWFLILKNRLLRTLPTRGTLSSASTSSRFLARSTDLLENSNALFECCTCYRPNYKGVRQ